MNAWRPSKVELCYNGVIATEFFPAEEAKPTELPPADLVIGTVCALRQEKGLPLLQEAFAKLNFLGRKLQLVMVGSGVELPRLQEMPPARNRRRQRFHAGAAERCTMDASDGYLRAAIVLGGVFQFTPGSYGLRLLVVGSRVGGTPELIGDSSRGLLFEPGNSQDLANRLTKLIGDECLRTEFGRRAAGMRERIFLSRSQLIERQTSMTSYWTDTGLETEDLAALIAAGLLRGPNDSLRMGQELPLIDQVSLSF